MKISEEDRLQLIILIKNNPTWFDARFRHSCNAKIFCNDCVLSRAREEEPDEEKRKIAECCFFFRNVVNMLPVEEQLELKMEVM